MESVAMPSFYPPVNTGLPKNVDLAVWTVLHKLTITKNLDQIQS